MKRSILAALAQATRLDSSQAHRGKAAPLLWDARRLEG